MSKLSVVLSFIYCIIIVFLWWCFSPNKRNRCMMLQIQEPTTGLWHGRYQQVPPSVVTTGRFPWYLTLTTVNKKKGSATTIYFSFLRHNSMRISLLGSIMATHQSQKMYSEPTLINAYLIGNRIWCLFSFWWQLFRIFLLNPLVPYWSMVSFDKNWWQYFRYSS